MATTHYSFPTINGTDTIDGVNAINGLANAVDTALYNVEQESGLPGASSITTTMLQNGCVTSAKLDSSVQSQIQQGVNASSTAQTAQNTAQSAETTATQALTAFNASPTNVIQSTSQGTLRAYKYGPLVIVQYYGTSLNLTTGGNDVGNIQSAYAPASQVESAASINGTQGAVGLYVASDGRVGLWAYNTVPSGANVRASVAYFVDK